MPPSSYNLAWDCLGRWAIERPEKTALIICDGSRSRRHYIYREIDSMARRLASGFLASGLMKGDRIMIRAANSVDFVLAFFAATMIGCVAQPASKRLTSEETRKFAADSGARAIVADDISAGEQVAPADLILFDHRKIERFLAEAAPAEYAATAADDPAYLVFTSGSTAHPKGVLHAHRVVIGRRPMAPDWLGLTDEDIVLHAGDINWTYALGVGVLDPFAAGATGVLYAGPRDPAIWPRLVNAVGATIFAAVPGVYRQILKYAEARSLSMPTLRHCVTAGEAMTPDLLAHWRDATGTWAYEALGMSEISTYVSCRPGDPIRPGSAGRPQRGRRVAILPVEGGEEPLAPGETGLIAVHRSDPGLMLGYWNRPEEESAVFRGEWFVGGDLAEFDADGFLWFRGRNDDIMNALGYRVSPLEVEKVLGADPTVADVAVAERQVAEGVSIIVGFVVPKGESQAVEADLLANCARHLASYKCPRKIVFISEIPRTPNGKLNRSALPQVL